MGFNKIILLSWLITSAVVIAQENKLGFGLSDVSYSSSSNLGIRPANISSIRNNIISFFNSFSRLPNLINPINTLRLKRSAEHHQENHSIKTRSSHQTRSTTGFSGSGHQNNSRNNTRLSVTTRLTSCNYANHPGSRCLSCREAITCFRNNRAVVRRCYFILRYCNKGRCSYTPGNKCYRTSTTTTTTSTSTTSSTSSTTTSPANTTSITTTASNNTTSTNSTSTTTTTRSTSANTTSTTTTTPSSTTTTTTIPSSSSSTATSTATSSASTTSASSTSTGSSSSTTNASTT